MAQSIAEPIALPTAPSSARCQIRSLLSSRRWPGDVDAVVLALHEALVNADRHGGGAVRAEAAVDHDRLVIQVWDRGPAFDLAGHLHRPPDPMAERGRGLWLIGRITSSCEVRRDTEGVVLVMRFDAS